MSDNHLMHLEGPDLPSSSGLPCNVSSNCGVRIAAGANGEIQHTISLSEQIGALFLNENCNDLTLIVEGSAFPAHRVILGARSDYFRAMLFGGMRETQAHEVELVDTPVQAFRLLLRYIYTGKLSLNTLKEELVLDVLGLAHKYGFVELETATSEYLKAILNVRNVCTIYGAAELYDLRSLSDVCLDYADFHASEILSQPGFLSLAASAVQKLISRDAFCAFEIEIFKAVQEWVRHHPGQEPGFYDGILSSLRLSLIRLDDLLNIVRPSGLLPADCILDAIKEQSEKRNSELTCRGLLMPRVNIATPSLNAHVIAGEMPHALLNGDTKCYDIERGFSRHSIDDRNLGIIVELGHPFIINNIRLLLWNRDPRSYSYYVETEVNLQVSMDKQDWVRVVDYTKYLCRSWQNLFFPTRVVKFIRVVGTHNTVNRVFHLVHLEASYSPDPFELDPSTNLLVPKTNVATEANGAAVIEGVSRGRNVLLDGETSNYDWDSGYTCHQLGSGAIVVQLSQPYVIDSIRLLLWDCDARYYSYYIEASCDQLNWHQIVDKRQEQCKGWQVLRFERQVVVFIRIVGTHNSANEVFHCVHFECPAQRFVGDSALFDEIVPVVGVGHNGLAIIANGEDPLVVHIQQGR